MVPRLKRRLAPWIAWEEYQRLTLSWPAAKFAQSALCEPPMVTLVLSYNDSSLKALRGIGFQRAERFPVLRLRSRAYPLATAPAEPSNFFIHRIDSGPVLA